MKDWTFLTRQKTQLTQLLEEAADNPILALQLKDRIDGIEGQLNDITQSRGDMFPEVLEMPRAAIFLRGEGGISDEKGIRLSLAGRVLVQYERMFTQMALYEEKKIAKESGRMRRRRGTPEPHLLLTGTPRGSFGFEFVPEHDQDAEMVTIHGQSLKSLADTIIRLGTETPDNLGLLLEEIPQKVFHPLKKFLEELSRFNVEIRFAFSDKESKTLTGDQIRQASDWLEKDVKDEEITVEGVFRGLTYDSYFFDLKTESEGEITGGTLDETLTEEQITQIANLTNKRCKATLLKTTIFHMNVQQPPKYVLLEAEGLEED